MIEESYPYRTDSEKEVYFFESIGPKGQIGKMIQFDFMGENTWNLAFGDRLDGHHFDDSANSNNGDLVKIMATVAETIRVFSERWPNRMIHIQPLDEKRKRLYNAIFSRHFHHIEADFYIFGELAAQLHSYRPERIFDRFLLVSKSATFVKN